MDRDHALRAQLARIQSWQDAHAGFDRAVSRMPVELQGRRPAGLPHSAWELVEHMRLTQLDILEFCRNPGYEERRWPEDYWPAAEAPVAAKAWEESLAGFTRDREALAALAHDRDVDLFARIPHGSGQTYLRELVLVADHTAYHVGQLVLVRQLLGAWPPGSRDRS